jgi:hypothetical protein
VNFEVRLLSLLGLRVFDVQKKPCSEANLKHRLPLLGVQTIADHLAEMQVVHWLSGLRASKGKRREENFALQTWSSACS